MDIPFILSELLNIEKMYRRDLFRAQVLVNEVNHKMYDIQAVKYDAIQNDTRNNRDDYLSELITQKYEAEKRIPGNEEFLKALEKEILRLQNL